MSSSIQPDVPPPTSGPPPPRGRRIGRLALKELRETLRDRRTIVTLVLMPVLVYPLLSIGFQKLLLTSLAKPGESEVKYYYGVEPVRGKPLLDDLLLLAEHYLEKAANKSGGPKTEGPAETGPSKARQPKVPPLDVWLVRPTSKLKEDVEERRIDVGIRVLESRQIRVGKVRGPSIRCELLYRDDRASREALDFLEQRLRALNDEFVRIRLAALGATEERPPAVIGRTLVEPSDEGMGISLAALVPLILILMTITGAVYPAIDLTAGERERGTLETLIAAPVPRMGLLLAKYVAVLTVALLTATVNLTAMTITIYSIGMGESLFGKAGLSPGVVGQVFGVLILFAAFFSAVLLAVTSFARSFKEAQAYLIPLMLMAIAPGLLSLNESLRLNVALAVTPLVNIVLLGRDLFSGTADPLMATVVILSTVLFAAAALALAARLFGTDALLYGSHGTWSEAFRRPLQPQPVASVSTAMLCLAIIFPAFFMLQGLLGQAAGLAMPLRLAILSFSSAVLFAGLPIFVARLRHVRLVSAFGLRRASALGFAGAALLGLSLWPLVHELVVLTQRVDLLRFDPAVVEKIAAMLRAWKQLPLPVILLAMAVVPAVFEELFFRGFLFHALAARTRPWKAIVVSALFFGLFHIFLPGGLATARFLPSTLMGLVLAWVCHRTGSVLPGIVLHACHNAFSLFISYNIESFNVESWGIEPQGHFPWTWLLAAGLGSLAGLVLLLLSSRTHLSNDEDETT